MVSTPEKPAVTSPTAEVQVSATADPVCLRLPSSRPAQVVAWSDEPGDDGVAEQAERFGSAKPYDNSRRQLGERRAD